MISTTYQLYRFFRFWKSDDGTTKADPTVWDFTIFKISFCYMYNLIEFNTN